ncbi:Rap1a/Tai family immunity protein [Ferrovibrio sp.]|uniref:Rap1a/Tai family immunity protein n=1 Tax=Ferrovibrio sp. TaxID=1917215 RepID=UPI0035B0F49F
MIARVSALAALFLLAETPVSHASNPIGMSAAGYLLQACEAYRNGTPSFDAAYCLGRVTGATWTLDANTTGLKRDRSCIPSDVNADQLVRIFIKFANENSHRLHEPDLRIVFDSMHASWNCLIVPK